MYDNDVSNPAFIYTPSIYTPSVVYYYYYFGSPSLAADTHRCLLVTARLPIQKEIFVSMNPSPPPPSDHPMCCCLFVCLYTTTSVVSLCGTHYCFLSSARYLLDLLAI